MHKIVRLFLKTSLVVMMAFGLLLASGFFAVRFGWTNVDGEEDMDSFEYNQQAKENLALIEELNRPIIEITSTTKDIASSSVNTASVSSLPKNESIYGPHADENWCKIFVAQEFNSHTALAIFEAYHKTRSEMLLNNMLLALRLRLPNRDEFAKKLETCKIKEALISSDDIAEKFMTGTGSNIYSWQNGEPWQIIRGAVIRDKEVIYKAAAEVGIQPRLLLSVAIVEQLRLYYTQRELFEKVFKPLKILANANKMAWGVMAIKEKMAMETEDHLKDINSLFYLGTSSAALLDFPNYEGDEKKQETQKNKERYNRLTSKDSHYYSYLYGALILKQFETQWERAGYQIKYRPEIVATLFNIGFHNSKPKDNPKVGGSTITIDEDKYYFGSLAFEFYYSGELMQEFPYE